MKKEYDKHDEEFKKMIVNLCETNKDKTMSDIKLLSIFYSNF